jgi:flagellar biosynthesis/type III secretory pathway protein FliH
MTASQNNSNKEDRTATPYDDVFRTLMDDCQKMDSYKKLLLPVLNEAFGTHYTGEEEIQFLSDKLYMRSPDGEYEKREVDSIFFVTSKHTVQYHMECQVRNDNNMCIRIFEYDSQLALRNSQLTNDTMVVRFPNTAVLYLDSTESTPDVIKIHIQTSAGEVVHEIPTIQIKNYSIETLFEKDLLFLLPFYIFNYSKYRVAQMEKGETPKQKEALETLLADFRYIVQEVEKLYNMGKIEQYVKISLITLSKKVLEAYLKNYQQVKGKVGEIMGGKVLEYEAKTILNQGISLGFTRGRSEGMREGRDEGMRLGRDEGLREGRDEGMAASVQMCKQFGKTLSETTQAIADAYHLSLSEAEAIVKENW